MRTISIEEPGKVQLRTAEKPVMGMGEILLKINYVGFCGSDLSTYLGKNQMVKYPRIPGHEISGCIEAVGGEVPSVFHKDQLVTVVPYTNCGVCPACRNGRSYACQFNQTLGVQRDGAMQEYLVVPWQKVLPAPGLDELELALVEPLTVGFHAVDRGRVSDTDTVLVIGCGMIGAGAIIRSVLRGARVIALDIDDYKLSLAKEIGATYSINSSATDAAAEIEKITGGKGVDVVIEAVGNPHTYRAAIDYVSFTGRVVYIGYAAKEVEFTTRLFVQKELDIMGSRNATAMDFQAVISYLGKRNFPVKSLVSKILKPEQAAEAMKEWAAAPGKVMKLILDLT